MDLVVHGGAVPTFLLERLLAATGARPAIRARADVASTSADSIRCSACCRRTSRREAARVGLLVLQETALDFAA
jgi:hypothetical protein